MDQKEMLDTAAELVDSIKSLKDEMDAMIKEAEDAGDAETAQKLKDMIANVLAAKEEKKAEEETDQEAMPAPEAQPAPEAMNDLSSVAKMMGIAFSDSAAAEKELLAVKALADNATKFLMLHDAKSFDEISMRLAKADASASAAKSEAAKVAAMNDAAVAVESAIRDGKLTEGYRKWAVDFATRDIKAFSDFVAGMPATAQAPKPLSQVPMNDVSKPAAPAKRQCKFSDIQASVAKAFGNDPEKIYAQA